MQQVAVVRRANDAVQPAIYEMSVEVAGLHVHFLLLYEMTNIY